MLVAGPASAATVTGVFKYADTIAPGCPYTATNCVPLQPIAFARVEIWHRGIFPWQFFAPVGETTTDATGRFWYSDGRYDGTYAVRVYATNYAVQVNGQSGSAFYVEPGNPGPNIYKTVYSANQEESFSFDFTDTDISRHFNVAETVRRGLDYANARRDPSANDSLSRATVTVTPFTGNPLNVSWYNPAAHAVILHTNSAFFDRSILHEYAHWLEAQLSSFAWIPADHNGCEARDVFGNIINSPEHAWMEGFADYFAQAVASFLPKDTLSIGGAGGLETPGPCAASSADAIQSRVAASLWDLHDPTYDPTNDPPSETHDFMNGGATAIFQIFDRELDVFGTWPTIWHFRNAWMARGYDTAGLDRILAHHEIMWLPNQTAQFISMSVPAQMYVGQPYQVSVTMRNTGVTTWTSEQAHRLGSQAPQDTLRWGLGRVALTSPVTPGAQVTFTFTVTAPSTAGTYSFQWRMLQELVEWFGDTTTLRRISVVTTTPPDDGGGLCFDPEIRKWIPCTPES